MAGERKKKPKKPGRDACWGCMGKGYLGTEEERFPCSCGGSGKTSTKDHTPEKTDDDDHANP